MMKSLKQLLSGIIKVHNNMVINKIRLTKPSQLPPELHQEQGIKKSLNHTKSKELKSAVLLKASMVLKATVCNVEDGQSD